ncbi:PKC1 (YBL105C) [Zygosaccharomyces parabailii]|nr:PKC1 (YBL105C) [Zygosaccharomyces parabailii]CDH16537.1 probable protein kinase C-like 1 [Zygosaccharomyces bailii ISA1307]
MYSQVEQEIQRKIERERNIIQGASNLKKKTNNVMVIQKCNTNIREARQNIEYLEETFNKLQLKSETPQSKPEKDAKEKGFRQLSTISPNEHMYSRLDLVKYDCPSLSQRIQYMLQQLEFKLQVERQYQEANAKLTKLYQIDGDAQSSSAAEGGAQESKNRILLLTKALKKYQAINVDLDQFKQHDTETLNNQPKFRRKQLTGELHIGVTAVRDVDHIQSPLFSRKPESYITVKIDDTVKARSRASRNDRWNEDLVINVERGNEVEITVYDKVNDVMSPVAIMWLLLSDIAEELRKKKVGQSSGQQGWVNASKVINSPPNGSGGSARRGSALSGTATASSSSSQGTSGNSISNLHSNKISTSSWFTLEPAGQLLLTLAFNKSSQPVKKNIVGGLHRHGAIINRQEEVYEQHGHHFVQKSFYNIMCCAYCGEFLRYTGFQCQDCKFLCHKKCYGNVVTKCIAKTTTESDPDEAKLNHRIPHRFEPVANRGTKWCCHCGYILPWGRQKVRKCTECGIMCHTQCAHLVPDFCGMSMEMANKILRTIQDTKRSQEKRKRISPSLQTQSSSKTVVGGGSSPGKASQRSTHSHRKRKSQTNVPEIKAPNKEQRQEALPPVTNPPERPKAKKVEATERLSKFIDQNEAYLNFTENAHKSDVPLEAAGRTLDPFASNDISSDNPYLEVNESEEARSKKTLENWKFQEQLAREESLKRKRHMQEMQLEAIESEKPLETSKGKRVEPISPETQEAEQQEEYSEPNVIDLGAISAHSNSNPFRTMVNESQQKEQIENANTTENLSLTQSVTAVSRNSYQTSPQKGQVTVKHKKKAAKKKKVSLDDFILLKVLGKGNFGKVLLSKSKNTGYLCAIKVLKKDHIIQNHDIESARAEKKVFLLATTAKHPFLTNLYCSFQTENRIYFAMEFIGGGDLMWHVQNQRLSVRRAKFYAAEVLLALKYFHDNGVIYRDLKLENILLTPEGHIKIADYGLCKDEMWHGCKTSTFCGTPEFMAPEILKEQEYTKSVDWWAFGVLLYQMLLCQSPFSGDDEDEVFNAILTDEPLYPIDMAGDIVQIFQGLLTKDPVKRLGAGPRDALEVMEEPFFSNINFDDILHLRVRPPYVPEIKSPEDTSFFEQEFTSAPPTLTPLPSVLDTKQQEEFRGFSFMPDDLEL